MTALAASLLAASCITVYEDAPLIDAGELEIPEYAVAQTIPLGRPNSSPQEQLLTRFYGSVLERMQEAADDRDTAVLFGLLDAYEKPNLPGWLADRLHGYRALGHGLRFVAHAMTNSRLALVAATDAAAATAVATPVIGAPIRFDFTLPGAGTAVILGGRSGDDPVGFSIAITYEDDYVDGGNLRQTRNEIEWLREDYELAGDALLRLPLSLEIDAGKAVRRTIHLRVDLMPGYIRDGEFRAPVSRRTLAALTLTQWPAGYEPIVKRPLATLREALRLGDAKHFPHIYIGAAFTKGPDRDVALGLLIDQIRLGRQELAVVAMATLSALTGADIGVGDREGWLAWWDMRR